MLEGVWVPFFSLLLVNYGRFDVEELSIGETVPIEWTLAAGSVHMQGDQVSKIQDLIDKGELKI